MLHKLIVHSSSVPSASVVVARNVKLLMNYKIYAILLSIIEFYLDEVDISHSILNGFTVSYNKSCRFKV